MTSKIGVPATVVFTPALQASGHGPVFGLATPTNPRGSLRALNFPISFEVM